MKNRIAVFLNTIDPIFLPEKYKNDCFIIVGKDTRLYKFARKNFSIKNMISIPMYSPRGKALSEKNVLYSKELIKKIKKLHITHVIIPHQSSKVMKDWAHALGISLIGTPFNKQKNLEDKIYFDNLLKKYNISSPKTLTRNDLKNFPTPVVVQEATSYGLFGTKFFESSNKASTWISQHKSKFLVREYKEGIPIGVSIFLDKNKNYFFSTFRRQCFQYKNGFPKVFLGIQWLPKKYFSKRTSTKIYRLLDELASVLTDNGFEGLANIDLLVSNDTPYILECNPRLSSATTQIFSINVCGYRNPYEFYLNIFLREKELKITRTVPSSNFDGCILDIDIQKPVSITNILPIGIYETKGKSLKFIGEDIKLLNKRRFFISHEIQRKGVYSNITVCSIIANTPLFDLTSGSLNKRGEEIYNLFLTAFQNK